jgi:hypothetical protein
MVLLCHLAGCSGEVSKSDVTGKITINNKEPGVEGIQIVFLGSDGTTVAAPVGEAGDFHAVGVSTGEAKLYFSAMTQEEAATAAKIQKGKGPRLIRPDGAGAATTKKNVGNYPKSNPIPTALRDPTSSGLTVDIAAGRMNTVNYDIKSTGGPNTTSVLPPP